MNREHTRLDRGHAHLNPGHKLLSRGHKHLDRGHARLNREHGHLDRGHAGVPACPRSRRANSGFSKRIPASVPASDNPASTQLAPITSNPRSATSNSHRSPELARFTTQTRGTHRQTTTIAGGPGGSPPGRGLGAGPPENTRNRQTRSEPSERRSRGAVEPGGRSTVSAAPPDRGGRCPAESGYLRAAPGFAFQTNASRARRATDLATFFQVSKTDGT